MNYDLSILIPARNEEYLSRTVQDILSNIEGKTEVIVVLDGCWADPPLPVHERVRVIHHAESIGQRAASNEAAKLSRAKYVMKVDAHCAFDKGFDVKMIEAIKGHDDWTMVPVMKNFHVFDWVCVGLNEKKPCGFRRYQSPTPKECPDCGGLVAKDIVWRPKPSPNSTAYCFDPEPHFQYFNEFRKRPEGRGDVTPTMSLQGSCFMMTREKYWELNICDEEFGSWGSQGIEVAVKTWLSGGQVMCNQKTWYAHMFRTQGGDFGFPYKLSGNQVSRAKHKARDLFFNNQWEKQIHPLSWLVKKFWPIHCWKEEDLSALIEKEKGTKFESVPSKGIIYYTDNELDPKIMLMCQEQLQKAAGDIPIVSASLKKMNFGNRNIRFPSLKRGYITMAKQILGALENSSADIIFFCEHDVMYHSSHFEFNPVDRETFYYNQNVWFVRSVDGHALHYDVNQLSGLCVYRTTAITHWKERIKLLEKGEKEENDFNKFVRNMGFEPFTHGRIKWEKQFKCGEWMSKYPNLDIKHNGNLTGQRWNKDQYRNQQLLKNWQEKQVDQIEGW